MILSPLKLISTDTDIIHQNPLIVNTFCAFVLVFSEIFFIFTVILRLSFFLFFYLSEQIRFSLTQMSKNIFAINGKVLDKTYCCMLKYICA